MSWLSWIKWPKPESDKATDDDGIVGDQGSFVGDEEDYVGNKSGNQT